MINNIQPELPNMPLKHQSGLFETNKASEDSNPVECLGMTFENETARRAYFTELLREKLKNPEFRAIEGFPIGEDEDILALSDPPYYTACPNPWVDNFIEMWESEKAAKPKGWTYHREPFAADVSEGKNNTIYNAHSFHTKVPHRAIMRYILHYTDPGDIVFDGFCGTGMTGVAAKMCDNRQEIENLGLKVEENGTILINQKRDSRPDNWVSFSNFGKRNAILNDLSPAASFISNNYNHSDNIENTNQKASQKVKLSESEHGWRYRTQHSDGRFGKIHYIVWSDVFICPNCSVELVFWDVAVDQENSKVFDIFNCPECNEILTKDALEQAWKTEFDKPNASISKQIKQIPVLINYKAGRKRYEKKPDSFDLDMIEKITHEKIPYWYPINRMMQGKEARRNDLIGLTHIHHYYYKRSLMVISHLWDLADNNEKFILQSILATLCSRMVRYNLGNRGNGILSGTLYVSSLIAESNVFVKFKRKLTDITRAKEILLPINNLVFCQNFNQIPMKEGSADYIFLDPPFGSNLSYSELNYIWESWLRIWTNYDYEAIENDAHNKNLEDYRTLITSCFKEAYRILKPGHWMTIVFSNTKASVWNSIQSALSDSGFIVGNISVLDKQQGSFKAVTTTTAVKQDLVISAYKPSGGFTEKFNKTAETEQGVWDFVHTHLGYLPVVKTSDDVLQHVPERDPRILYDQLVSYYVRHGFMVPISSQAFQTGLRQRFAERDGMVFLANEVAEYDQAKLRLGNEIQYSLFVSDESSAIDWMNRFLKEKPQTYQEIQPSFMREAQRAWKKNEKPVELQALLEQNFLRYDGIGPVPPQIHSYLSSNWKEYRNLEKDNPDLKAKAKDRWYVPDPNQAGDLEKLRERALLREFETYTEDKKKLKLFRLEALRAGFKKAYVENDYKTIMAIADRLPQNTLEEDPKLLMWYDLAKTRMEG